MNPPNDNVSSTSDTGLGRAVLSDQQWRSLARSLHLSGREIEVLRCVFDDQTEAGMALELGISCHTVHTHLERLYRKLGVRSRCAAVVRVFGEHLARKSPVDGDGQPRRRPAQSNR